MAAETQTTTIEREQEKSELETRLRAMSEDERHTLLQDALDKYNDMELLIHTINRIEDSKNQDPLF